MRLILIAVWIALLPAFAFAAPPPPPPDFIFEAAKTLTTELNQQTFDAYSALLADDLHVYVDDRQAASDKFSWLTIEKARLGKVERHFIGVAEGRDNILVVDEFDDRSGLPVRPGLLFDPRFITRAARYQFGSDHMVHEIRFVQGGGFWISMRGSAPKD
jgi:hypothetical protein